MCIFLKIAGTEACCACDFRAFWRGKRTGLSLYAQTLAERGFVTLAFDPSIQVKAVVNPAILLHLISIPKLYGRSRFYWTTTLCGS